MLGAHAFKGFQLDPLNVENYLMSISDPAAIHAMCEDYPAAWTIDRDVDESELERSNHLDAFTRFLRTRDASGGFTFG